MIARTLNIAAVVVMALLLAASFKLLHNELGPHQYHEIVGAVALISPTQALLAVLFTAASYLALALSESLAVHSLKRQLPVSKVGLAAFISNAFSSNVGAVFSGGAVRYRLYTAWGLSSAEIAQLIVYTAVTFWLGLLVIAGWVFVAHPVQVPVVLRWALNSTFPLGVICLLILCATLIWRGLFRKPFALKGWRWEPPSFQLSAIQLIAAICDWLGASAALFVLLPHGNTLSFPLFLSIYLLAVIAGLVSQVPGGLGVFETVMLFLLAAYLPRPAVFGALFGYRVIYYLLPLLVAAILLGLRELLAHRKHVTKAAELLGKWLAGIVPHFFSAVTFVGGAILLLSGAAPAVAHRLKWLEDFIPLPVAELSHFLASIAGVGLLLLARGLQRRLNGAFAATLILLGLSISFSLLKGFDYEEAMILSIMLAALIPCRREFYRKTALINEPFSIGWIAAIALVIMGALWLGVFSYKHVKYAHELWWQFDFSADAPRFLRASVGAVGVVVWFAAARLLRPARQAPGEAGALETSKARAIVGQSQRTSAYLALLGDKRFLLNEAQDAFVMYGVHGRSWVALGDPVGSSKDLPELVWGFRELCDRYDGWTIFYDVGPEQLPAYLDIGLTLLKIGEEARVPLAEFSLEGGDYKDLRYAHRKLAKEGCTFEVAAKECVPRLLPELKAVSDAWLKAKNTKEKRFSLGYFNPEYLQEFPVGLVRQQGSVIAFSNLWLGAGRQELSIDLMRYGLGAPRGVMDYLFVELMLWGKQQGFRSFNLGTVPLSGLENRALAPLWSRMGAFMFRHGEDFYNFQGLRQYKEKFNPVWEPRYIACPGSLALPRMLLDVAALIAGSVKGIVAK